MADAMGAEAEAQRLRKGDYLRRDHGIRPTAGDNQDTGVVDDAKRAAAVMEAYRLEQKLLGLETGEARVVLNEQSA
jgi:hypothetical protein